MRRYDDGKRARKRSKEVEYWEVEKSVLQWFKQCRDKNVPVSGHILKEKAVYFAKEFSKNFRASNGWLEKLKKRNKIIVKAS